MHPLPHRYEVTATATSGGSSVEVGAPGLPSLETGAPPQFGGAPGRWSPETLLAGAVADCFILTFHAVARAGRLQWESLHVEVDAVLDRVDGVTRFTQFVLRPRLVVEAGVTQAQAMAALEKAKGSCLVTRSLVAASELQPQVTHASAQAA